MFRRAILDRWVRISWYLASLLFLGLALIVNPYDRSVAWNTISLGMASSVVSIPLGLALAWVSYGNRPFNRGMLACTVMLLAVPVFLHVSTWDAAFGRLGWIKSSDTLTLQPFISGWPAASWIHGVAATPQVAVIFLIGLLSSRQTIEEQALLDAPRWRVFWHIRVRPMAALFLLAGLWTIVSATREIAASDLYQVGTLAEQIYLGYSLGQFNAIVGGWSNEDLAAAANLNYSLAMIVLFWIAATSAMLIFRLIGQENESEVRVSLNPMQRRDVLESPSSLRNKKILASALLILLVVGPVCNLLIRASISVDSVDGQPVSGYSLEQLGKVLHRSVWNYQREFKWTLLIGFTSSISILAMATPMVWKAPRSATCQFLLCASWVVSCTLPGPMTGTLIGSLFHIFDGPGIEYLFNRTIFAPVLATIVFCWPFPPLIIWFLFRKIPREIIDHARLDGAGQGTIFWRFGVRDQLPQLFGCWLVTFAICMGELSASQIVLPPGIDTLPRLMLGLLHAGVDEMTAGITLVLMALIGTISCVGWKMIHRNATI
jgi:iron(III) transport system permease protein